MGLKNEQVLARRQEVWRLRTQECMSQLDIAARMGVHQSQISRDLDWWTKQTISQMTEVIEREKVVQIAQLQQIIFEAMQGWRESKKPRKLLNTRKKRQLVGDNQTDPQTGEAIPDGPQPVYAETEVVTTTTVEERIGNPAFLSTALSGMADLRSLLGLEPPKQVKIDWKKELLDAGYDPSSVFEKMVQAAYDVLGESE